MPEEVTDRAALARLKLVRKSELPEIQRADPPFGGLSVIAAPQAAKLFSSPGPVFELEPRTVDPWRAARALRAAGFRSGDVVHNSFSYHLTPAGSMAEGGARALGAAASRDDAEAWPHAAPGDEHGGRGGSEVAAGVDPVDEEVDKSRNEPEA